MEQIVNYFYHFFTSVGEKATKAVAQLATDNKIGSTIVSDPPKYNGRPFNFSPLLCMEVRYVINAMPSNKSTGTDKVDIKQNLPVILDPLTDNINRYLATSTFADYRKLAEVLPLLKDGDHEQASNNRLLSFLMIASKICFRATYPDEDKRHVLAHLDLKLSLLHMVFRRELSCQHFYSQCTPMIFHQQYKYMSFVDDSKLSLSFPIKDIKNARHNLENVLRHVAAWCWWERVSHWKPFRKI